MLKFFRNRPGMADAAPNCALRLLILCCVLLPWSAGATRVDPFRADIEVSDRGETERNRAFSRAMAQVLVKLSGDSVVPSLGASRPLLSSPRRYVRSWSYEQIQDVEDQERVELQVNFDRDALLSAMRNQSLPVWPSERPDVMLVLLQEQDYQRVLLDPDHALVHQALDTARTRAVPLVIPIYDLDDRLQLREEEIWAGFMDGVRGAAQRYGVTLTVVGRLSMQGDEVEGRWTIIEGAREQELEPVSGASAEDVVIAAMQSATDIIGRQFATVPNNDGGQALQVRVTRVRGPMDYARAFNYLRGLSVVQRLEPIAAEQGAVSFRLTASVDAEVLAQAISTGRVLRLQEQRHFSNSAADFGLEFELLQ